LEKLFHFRARLNSGISREKWVLQEVIAIYVAIRVVVPLLASADVRVAFTDVRLLGIKAAEIAPRCAGLAAKTA
jgi:hypothetical protein